ncbi:hypothetical protein C8D87_1011124 [Lentzea atacamensis]|uniref:Uncharacterized protein n=1 Tax=Lentzea atacamensis TaxID=531938 RepID=A0ABX9ELT8_9PSEU|nr:hypothetical protein [Lentzea atacamensis]RAS70823.1 hypothetical protein C8D87_1011124 [Lentzea atacamensis]
MPKMSLSRFTSVGVAIAAVLALGAPATAAAEVRLQGTISWRLVKAANPTADQQRAYDLITRAMQRAALHEISHTIGVGTSGKWRGLGCGGTYNGSRATALVKQYGAARPVRSPGAVIAVSSARATPSSTA